jgi:hypothetical protein
MTRPSRTQLEQARRESRGARAGFGETPDRVWHALRPASFTLGTAVLACSGQRLEVWRTATDMPATDITCGRCREERTTAHVG